MGWVSKVQQEVHTDRQCVCVFLVLIKLVLKLYPSKSEHEETMCYINDGLVTSTYVRTDEAASAKCRLNSSLKSSI